LLKIKNGWIHIFLFKAINALFVFVTHISKLCLANALFFREIYNSCTKFFQKGLPLLFSFGILN